MDSPSSWVGSSRARVDRGLAARARRPLAALVIVTAAAVAASCAAPGPSRRSVRRPTTTTTSTVPATTSVPISTTTTTAPAPPTTRPASIVAGSHVASGTRLGVGGCSLFPVDHAFHADVRSLPVRAGSDATVATIGGDAVPVRAGFSNRVWEGSRRGTPVNVIDAATAQPTDFAVAAYSLDWSSASGVPLPAEPRYEGWPGRAWDRHLLLVDPATCDSRELINVQPAGENLTSGGRWYADAITTIDLSSDRAPDHGVVAAKLSLLSGMVRYDEVASGDIGHVITMSLPVVRSGDPVWPAQGSDGRSDDPAAPPMGSWFRLRPDADLSGLGPEALVVAHALQKYGAVAVDSGPFMSLDGEPDLRWDDDDLDTLESLRASDLQVIDPTPMRATSDPEDLRIR